MALFSGKIAIVFFCNSWTITRLFFGVKLGVAEYFFAYDNISSSYLECDKLIFVMSALVL